MRSTNISYRLCHKIDILFLFIKLCFMGYFVKTPFSKINCLFSGGGPGILLNLSGDPLPNFMLNRPFPYNAINYNYTLLSY